MTVYVDNARTPARVGRIQARWSHLTASTPDELHAFAARLGQRREWFQARCKHGNCPTLDGVCVHFHYDVVDGKRTDAIRLGAKAIDLREMGALTAVRRRQFASMGELELPEPCQPIGCDNGHHLIGCWYAAVDAEVVTPVTDYDRDPEALAWARAKVQREIDKLRDFERQCTDRGDAEKAAQWRKMRNLLAMRFIGGTGCVIAAFDERRPAFAVLLDNAKEPTAEEVPW